MRCSGVNCRSSRIVGSRLLARRSSAGLPPASRLCCASASAFDGLDFDLLLTNTTCSGCVKLAALRGSGSTSAMPNKIKACSAMEMEKAIGKDNDVFKCGEIIDDHVLSLAIKQLPPVLLQSVSVLQDQANLSYRLPVAPGYWQAIPAAMVRGRSAGCRSASPDFRAARWQ